MSRNENSPRNGFTVGFKESIALIMEKMTKETVWGEFS